jgi:hypothetical protein
MSTIYLLNDRLYTSLSCLFRLAFSFQISTKKLLLTINYPRPRSIHLHTLSISWHSPFNGSRLMLCAMWIAINMSLGAVSEGDVWRGGTMGPVGGGGGGGEGGSHGPSHQTTWLLAPTCRWLKTATGMLVACCRGNFYNVKI